MKIKTTAVLIIFLAGLLPVVPAAAQSPASGTLDESVSLAFASHSILLNQVDGEDAGQTPSTLQEAREVTGNDASDALGHLIHATKQQRNELNDSCRTLRAAYQAEGKTCELQILNDYCKAEEAKLNQRLGLLHRLRGDRRKFFTRVWHSVKRTGNRVWSAVGPLGRRVLRNVGSEAAEVVLSGGSLSGGVIRKLLVKEARNLGEAELNRLLERGAGRFLQSQAALAQAAGLEDCSDEKLAEARQQVAGDAGLSPDTDNQGNDAVPEAAHPQVSFTGHLSFVCDEWVGDGGDSEGMAKIPLDVNFDSGDFYGEESFPFTNSNGNPQTSTFVYQGSVSKDGLLIGKKSASVTVDNVDVGSVGVSVAALGIITEDGSGLYLSFYQESDTEMIQLYSDGREAVLNFLQDRGQSLNPSENPPNCR